MLKNGLSNYNTIYAAVQLNLGGPVVTVQNKKVRSHVDSWTLTTAHYYQIAKRAELATLSARTVHSQYKGTIKSNYVDIAIS